MASAPEQPELLQQIRTKSHLDESLAILRDSRASTRQLYVAHRDLTAAYFYIRKIEHREVEESDGPFRCCLCGKCDFDNPFTKQSHTIPKFVLDELMGSKGLALGFIGDAVVKDVSDVKYPQLLCDSCENRLSKIESKFSGWMKRVLKASSNPKLGKEIQDRVPFVVSLLWRCFVVSLWDKLVPEQNVSAVLELIEHCREFLVQDSKPKKKKKTANEPWKNALWFMYVENYDIEKPPIGSPMDFLFKENIPHFEAFQPDCWVLPDGMCVHFGKFFFFCTFQTEGPLYDLVSKYANPLCDSHPMRTMPVLPLPFFELLSKSQVPLNQTDIGHPDLQRFLDSHPGLVPRITDGTKVLEQFLKQDKHPGSQTPKKFFVDGDPEQPWHEWILKDMALRSWTMKTALHAEWAIRRHDFVQHGQLAALMWHLWLIWSPKFLIPGSPNWINLPPTVEDVPVHYFLLRLFQQHARKLLIDVLNCERRDREHIQEIQKELDLFTQQLNSLVATSEGGLPGFTQMQTWECNRPILASVERTVLLAKLVVHIKRKQSLSQHPFSLRATMCLRSSYTDVSMENTKDIGTLMGEMLKEYQAVMERVPSFPTIHVQAFSSADAPSTVCNCGRTSLIIRWQ
eukprot:ANDGO_01879.mRNA.1 hypothetical protein